MFQALTTCDTIPADVVAHRYGNAKLDALTTRYKLEKGGKRALDEKEFGEFAVQFMDAVQDNHVIVAPGGSSANTVTTINKLLGNLIDVTFIGVVGNGTYNNVIRDWLQEADICNTLKRANTRLVPDLSASVLQQSAVSFVILDQDGERTIVTYPGNAKTIIGPKVLPGILAEDQGQALFLQGSTRRKFGAEFNDKLLEWRWGDKPEHHKKLILALPTHALTGDEKEYFQWLVTSADMVLGNKEEMEGLGTNFAEFQKLLSRSSVKNPVAFITNGKEGATIVRADDRPSFSVIAATPIANKVNTLGCGDAFFAGVMAAAALDLKHPKMSSDILWARVGAEIAGATLQIQGAQCSNPLGALQKSELWPSLSEQWLNDGRRQTLAPSKWMPPILTPVWT